MSGYAKGNRAEWKALVELREMNALDFSDKPHTITVVATLIAHGRLKQNTDLHLLENNNLITK